MFSAICYSFPWLTAYGKGYTAVCLGYKFHIAKTDSFNTAYFQSVCRKISDNYGLVVVVLTAGDGYHILFKVKLEGAVALPYNKPLCSKAVGGLELCKVLSESCVAVIRYNVLAFAYENIYSVCKFVCNVCCRQSF